MALTISQKEEIKDVIKRSLRRKFNSYHPETKHMPFHYRLLGKDRMALFSFIHSLNTTFGTSIFEPVAKALAEHKFSIAEKQYVLGNQISEQAQIEIQHILNDISSGKDPNKAAEIERIRGVARAGKMNQLKTVKVDLFIQESNGAVHMFDLKTAKPNISNFKDFKRTLLEWVAIYLAAHPDATISTYIAIPYNPYYPAPYERWTLKGMLDLNHELKVAEEFWDFIGGDGAYQDLLDCFEEAGIELRPEIDRYFAKYSAD